MSSLRQKSTSGAKVPQIGEISPKPVRIPFDAIDWEGLGNDADVLMSYGFSQYDALKAVSNSFCLEFADRLHGEIKARSRAEWKEETFARLKAEFEGKKQ